MVGQCIDSPSFAALHFTGSTFVFKKLWKDIAQNLDKYKGYPRIVGETGKRRKSRAFPGLVLISCLCDQAARIFTLCTRAQRSRTLSCRLYVVHLSIKVCSRYTILYVRWKLRVFSWIYRPKMFSIVPLICSYYPLGERLQRYAPIRNGQDQGRSRHGFPELSGPRHVSQLPYVDCLLLISSA